MITPLQRRTVKKPVSEMNVVPYIDVMLVLLVIFMVTAPLLTQGVSVDLPQASNDPVESETLDPLILTVDANGGFYLNISENPKTVIEPEQLKAKVATVLRVRPKTPVLVKGDRAVPYGSVIQAMSLLQAAGAPNVGLITEMPDQK